MFLLTVFAAILILWIFFALLIFFGGALNPYSVGACKMYLEITKPLALIVLVIIIFLVLLSFLGYNFEIF